MLKTFNYKYFDLIKEGQNITTIKTKYAKEKNLNIVSNQNIKKYLKNDFDISKLEIKYDGVDTVNFNEKVGSKLGTISLVYEGNTLDSFDTFLNNKLHFSILAFTKENILIITVSIIILLFVLKPKKKLKHKRV